MTEDNHREVGTKGAKGSGREEYETLGCTLYLTTLHCFVFVVCNHHECDHIHDKQYEERDGGGCHSREKRRGVQGLELFELKLVAFSEEGGVFLHITHVSLGKRHNHSVVLIEECGEGV